MSLLLHNGAAQAQAVRSQLACLARSKGQYLEWKREWQNDYRDHGAYYLVTNAVEFNKHPNRSVTLTLEAKTHASVKHRTLVADAEDIARRFCEALRLNLPHAHSDVRFSGPGMAESASNLPFIHYSREGWVRGDAPVSERTTVCRVLNKRFSCLAEEKDRYGSTLKSLEEELRAEALLSGN